MICENHVESYYLVQIDRITDTWKIDPLSLVSYKKRVKLGPNLEKKNFPRLTWLPAFNA